MKRFLGKAILSSAFQRSLLAPPLRALVRATDRIYRYSPRFKLDMQAVARPHYAYCMLKAADLARALDHPDYARYVGGTRQDRMEDALRLK